MKTENSHPSRTIVRAISKKEITLAVIGALLVLGCIFYGMAKMGNGAMKSSITGTVVAKKFVPQAETQLTIGNGGVQRNDLAGKYFLSVRVEGTGEIYSVLLSEGDYERVQVGDNYQIPQASLIP